MRHRHLVKLSSVRLIPLLGVLIAFGAQVCRADLMFRLGDSGDTQTNVGDWANVGTTGMQLEGEALNFPSGKPIVVLATVNPNGQPDAGGGDGIVPSSASFFTSGMFQPTGILFGFEIFEVNVRASGFYRVQAVDDGGTTFTFDNSGPGYEAGPGNNKFQVYSLDSQYITKVTIESVSDLQITEFKGVRLGGIQQVPEPSSLAMLTVVALGGLCAVIYRRRRAVRN